MAQQAMFLDLLRSEYRLQDASMEPIATRVTDDRAVFRASAPDGSFVLHGYIAALTRSA